MPPVLFFSWNLILNYFILADELQQALRKIGRDDIVQKMKNKNDLDEEGDSLRLADSKGDLRRSKGSLGGAPTAAPSTERYVTAAQSSNFFLLILIVF